MTGSGMAVKITDSRAMTRTLNSLLDPESQRACWESIKNHFTDSTQVSENIVDVMYKNEI